MNDEEKTEEKEKWIQEHRLTETKGEGCRKRKMKI